jgi:hypothetical protein
MATYSPPFPPVDEELDRYNADIDPYDEEVDGYKSDVDPDDEEDEDEEDYMLKVFVNDYGTRGM